MDEHRNAWGEGPSTSRRRISTTLVALTFFFLVKTAEAVQNHVDSFNAFLKHGLDRTWSEPTHGKGWLRDAVFEG